MAEISKEQDRSQKERRQNKWAGRVVVRGRACQDSWMNARGERVIELKRRERKNRCEKEPRWRGAKSGG